MGKYDPPEGFDIAEDAPVSAGGKYAPPEGFDATGEVISPTGKANSGFVSAKSPVTGMVEAYGVRPIVQGAAGLMGIVADPLAATYNAVTPDSWPKISRARDAASVALDTAGYDKPQGAAGRVASDVVEGMTGTALTMGAGNASPVLAKLAEKPLTQMASAATGTLSGSAVREMGGGPAAQFVASLAGGAVGGWMASPLEPDVATDMMLRDRGKTVADSSDDVLRDKLKADYDAAKTAAGWNSSIKASNVPTEFNSVVAANKPTITMNPAAKVEIQRALSLANKQTGVMDTDSMDAIIKALRGRARTQYNNPNGGAATANILDQLADAMERDLDNTMLQSAAASIYRQNRRNWGTMVLDPYKNVRGGLFGDPSEAWKYISRASPEAKKRLYEASDEATRQLLKKRVVRQLIEIEESKRGFGGGSAAPKWRQMNDNGFGAFFTKKEWQGLKRITGRLSFFKNPFVKVAGAGLGASSGDLTGAAGFLAADYIATTTRGRLFLERVATLPTRELDASLTEFLTSPGMINAQLATRNGAEDLP